MEERSFCVSFCFSFFIFLIGRSFETVCLRLRRSFENLKPMFSGVESSDTVLDALVQQAFLGIQTVHSVRQLETLLMIVVIQRNMDC